MNPNETLILSDEQFYKNNYNNIKRTEKELLLLIKNKLFNLNEQSETKIIEHLSSRIKKPESAILKLQLAGYEQTENNAIEHLSDVIGIRIVTHFLNDIYTIRNILVNCGDFEIVKEKDYVKKSKPSGYRGYHIIINTNINNFKIKVEIQLRTVAMDCWASLEHQIRYKKNIKTSDLINSELKKCSDDLMSADIAMEQIWNMVKIQTESLVYVDSFFSDAMSALPDILNANKQGSRKK